VRRKVALAFVVIVVIGGVGYLAYNQGVMISSPEAQLASSSALTHVAALAIFNSYQTNAALADSEYQGKSFYILGEVGDVESQNGNYRSCIMASSMNGPVSVTGCGYTQAVGGYVVWNWKNQSAAAALGQITTNLKLAAVCVVGGFQNGNLILKECVVSQKF